MNCTHKDPPLAQSMTIGAVEIALCIATFGLAVIPLVLIQCLKKRCSECGRKVF